MKRALLPIIIVCISITASALRDMPIADINVYTRNYNNQRTGANYSETKLNPKNVKPGSFGKLYEYKIDDKIYAGLLYASNIKINNEERNLLFAATTNNTIYAFDADVASPPIWERNFNKGFHKDGRPSLNTEVGKACGKYKDFIGNIGIVGTPVINKSNDTIYFVTRINEGGGTVQRLHALDIKTGKDKIPATTITAPKFDPLLNNQRPALALSKGVIYIGWASFCDSGKYHGLMMSYDANTLKQLGVYNATPQGFLGGIWMSGGGPAFDKDGNMYVATGNGSWDGVTDFSNSAVKLSPKEMKLLDWFTPQEWEKMNSDDSDFGSGFPIYLQRQNIIVTGDKLGKTYVFDVNNLGKTSKGDSQARQVFQAVGNKSKQDFGIYTGFAVWDSVDKTNLYVWGANDYLRLYRFNNETKRFDTRWFATGEMITRKGMPGALLTITSNGFDTESAIVWATIPKSGHAGHQIVPGALYAFAAYPKENQLQMLWSSTDPADNIYEFSKGTPPLVVNGKVYVASQSNIISAFGLKQINRETE